MTRTRDEIISDIIHYFKQNEDIFNDLIQELDSWNGYLGDDRYYSMTDLDEIYRNEEPVEILYRAFYGYDEESWTYDEHGNKVYQPFNPNREHFRYNGYGNLVSSDYIDYSDRLDKPFVEALAENRADIYALDNIDLLELTNLLDELDESEVE